MNKHSPAMNDNRPVHLFWQGVHAVPEIDESDNVMRNTSIWPASAVHVVKNALLLILNINEGKPTIMFNQYVHKQEYSSTFC